MLILKATLILLAAGGVCLLLRRSSAAARQLVWTLALNAVLLLPLISVTMPPVRPKITISQRVAVLDRVNEDAPEQTPAAAFPWGRAVRTVYLAGIAAVLARLLLGSARVAWIARRSHAFPGAPASVRVTSQLELPVAWGLFRPVILLPKAALEWPPERIRLVLAHETAHIRRVDFPGQVAAQLACAVYWFHPLAWWAFKQLIKEREQACDDEVLNMGIKGTVYADHLLNIVRAARKETTMFSPAVGMAQGPAFEQRLRAMLNPGLNRRAPGRHIYAASALLVAILLLPLGALQLASQTMAALQGVVRDPSGAVIPHARILAIEVGGSSVEAAVSGPDGSFHVEGIKPGRYRVEVKAPGFAPYQVAEMALNAGSVTKIDAGMNVGPISESLEVVGKRVTAKPQVAPQRIRVGGMVQASKLLNQVPPAYPQAAQQKGIEGTVLLRAVIGTDGRLLSLGAASTSADPELIKAALDAVQQWTYEPTLLNGEPVEVATTVAVTFRLQ